MKDAKVALIEKIDTLNDDQIKYLLILITKLFGGS